jgi:hypothetical protein
MRALRTLGIMRLDGRRQIAVTAHYISTFFDVYLKGAPLRISRANRSIRRLNTSIEHVAPTVPTENLKTAFVKRCQRSHRKPQAESWAR